MVRVAKRLMISLYYIIWEKANVVVDTISIKAERMHSLAYLPLMEKPLAMDGQDLANQFVRLDVSEPRWILAYGKTHSSLLEHIKDCQLDDTHLLVLRETVQQGGAKEIVIGDDGVVRLQGRIWVQNVHGLRDLILEKVHSSCYSIYPGVTKMYRDLKQYYWWWRMKKDIVAYVSRCLR
ncbi:uncharacterized protein [Nicotiana sylvestris]|uniref:uncharacterized protein n=1 Tax=Nicotiana sylvestris TaxID=4096 RepID=UPI00388CB3EC